MAAEEEGKRSFDALSKVRENRLGDAAQYLSEVERRALDIRTWIDDERGMPSSLALAALRRDFDNAMEAFKLAEGLREGMSVIEEEFGA